jgi:hypothetical protein
MTTYKLTQQNVYDRARERGYTEEEVQGCFVKDLGNGFWLVDIAHPAYPKPRDGWPGGAAPCGGPGTELKKLFSRWLGVKATPNCSCNGHALEMDSWGPDGCEQHMPTILGWLEEQAKGRGIPYFRFAVERVVRLAISRVRRRRDRQSRGT